MPYTSPATVVTGTTITTAWGNSVKAAADFLANPPACRVYNSAAITVGTGALTALTFNTERFDTDSMHSTSVNTGRITFNTAGLYTVTLYAGWIANAAGIREFQIRLNGTTSIAQWTAPATAVADDHRMTITSVYKMAAGDFVEALAFQTSGGNLNVQSLAAASPEFSAAWIGLG